MPTPDVSRPAENPTGSPAVEPATRLEVQPAELDATPSVPPPADRGETGDSIPSLEATRSTNASDSIWTPAASAAMPRMILPREFGNYVLLEELGAGGMGVVYKARQKSPDRLVALKMIRSAHLASDQDIRRFRQEADLAASVDHPNVVPVYDFGEVDGQHYFSMKLVEGQSLSQGREKYSNPREAAQLLATIARAVHHAHQRQMLHRDLKPGNILLDAHGHPHVADFGLARRLDAESATLTGAILGTPGYMAPEQARGQKHLTTGADIYGLGAILYSLLTGRAPFKGEDALETMRLAMSEDPVAPRSLNPRIPRDLETICLKCLSRDPEQRYASADALAEDLDHWLQGRPIAARPQGRLQKAWRWAKRNPLLAVTGSIAAVALVGIAGLSAIMARTEARSAAELRQANEQLDTTNTDLQQALDRSEDRRREVQRQVALSYLDRGLSLAQRNEADVALLWLARGLAAVPEKGADDVERTLRLALSGWARGVHPISDVFPHAQKIVDIDLSPDGRSLLTLTDDRVAHVWEAGREPRHLPLGVEKIAWVIRWAPGGDMFFTSAEDGLLRRWNARTGAAVGDPWPTGKPLKRFTFTPDGKMLLTATGDAVVIRNATTGEPIGAPLKHPRKVRALAVSTDGRLVATGAEDQKPRLWDLATRQEVGPPVIYSGTAIDAVALSKDADTLACGGFGGSVFAVSVGRRQVLGAVKHQIWARATCFHPQQDLLLTSGDDKTARLWRYWNGHPAGPPLRHAGIVWHALFDPSGDLILTADEDAVWARRLAPNLAPPQRIPSPIPNHPEVLASDGVMLLGAADRGDVRCWDLTTGQPIGTPLADTLRPDALALAPDNRTAVTATEKHLRVWRVPEGKLLLDLPGERGLKHIQFVGDGSQFVTAGWARDVEVRETATGKVAAPGWRHANETAVAFSPDGRLVVMQVGDRGQGRLRDSLTGAARFPVFRMSYGEDAVKFSPDGRRLAIAAGVEIDLRDAADGRRLAVLKGHRDRLTSMAFSNDGSWLVTGSADTTARIWNENGQPAPFVLSHAAELRQVALSPDGALVVTTAGDDIGQLWERASGRMLGPPVQGVSEARFLRGGSQVWMASIGRVQILPMPVPIAGTSERVQLWCEVLTGLTLDSHGHPQPLSGTDWQARRTRLRTLDDSPPK